MSPILSLLSQRAIRPKIVLRLSADNLHEPQDNAWLWILLRWFSNSGVSIVVLLANMFVGGEGGLLGGGVSTEVAASIAWNVDLTWPIDLAALADISSLKPVSPVAKHTLH